MGIIDATKYILLSCDYYVMFVPPLVLGVVYLYINTSEPRGRSRSIPIATMAEMCC